MAPWSSKPKQPIPALILTRPSIAEGDDQTPPHSTTSSPSTPGRRRQSVNPGGMRRQGSFSERYYAQQEAQQGQNQAQSPQQQGGRRDPALDSPFQIPSVRGPTVVTFSNADQGGISPTAQDLANGNQPYSQPSSPSMVSSPNTQTPRKNRARMYPSGSGYESPPLGGPDRGRDMFGGSVMPDGSYEGGAGSRSRSTSPMKPIHNGGVPYLERIGSGLGIAFGETKGSAGGSSTSTPPPLSIDPLQTSSPIVGYAGDQGSTGVSSGKGDEVWARHSARFFNDGGELARRGEAAEYIETNTPTASRFTVELADQYNRRNKNRGTNGQQDEDSDEGEDKRSRKTIQRIFLSTLGRIVPYSVLSLFLTAVNKRSDDAKARQQVLDSDLRRKSTGTSSAAVRARKQQIRRGEVGWVEKYGWMKWGFLLLLFWVGWNRLTGSGDGDGPYQPLATSITKNVAKLLSREPTVKLPSARLAELFDPNTGIYKNLPRTVLEPTRYHPTQDGLLIVNQSAPIDRHPIYQLIKTARDEWDLKKKRQSKTLSQAVEEYKRRNQGMVPPKGFEKWWAFVIENDVHLPDEYDQINRDLYLFRALSPEDLNRRLDLASEMPDTFTISIKHHNVRTRSTYDGVAIEGADDRLEAQIELLMDYGMEEWLGDMRVVYGIHDGPQGFIGYDQRADLISLVEDGEYFTNEEEVDTTTRGWEAACPYGSVARSTTKSNRRRARQLKTFVSDPKTSQMDICRNPVFMDLHGVLNGRRPHVQESLLPMFTLSKTVLHTDVLGVPMEQWMEDMPDVPWQARTKDRLLWRGSNTGAYYTGENTWRKTHRVRLVDMAGGGRDNVDILLPPKADEEDDHHEDEGSHFHTLGGSVYKTFRVDKETVKQDLLDVAFAGSPLQCNAEDGTCDQLAEEYTWAHSLMTFEEALQHKYVIDVDGNTWSSRFQRLLLGGSLVFKSTIMPEWWNDRAQPWVHYVPVQLDYSDVLDALVFFRGDEDGKGGEEALAQQIAEEGKKWVQTHWRKVDMAAYIGRVYLEWARLVAPNRKSMDFVYTEEMEFDWDREAETTDEEEAD